MGTSGVAGATGRRRWPLLAFGHVSRGRRGGGGEGRGGEGGEGRGGGGDEGHGGSGGWRRLRATLTRSSSGVAVVAGAAAASSLLLGAASGRAEDELAADAVAAAVDAAGGGGGIVGGMTTGSEGADSGEAADSKLCSEPWRLASIDEPSGVAVAGP